MSISLPVTSEAQDELQQGCTVAPRVASLPLCVDLDGTLIKGDVLFEAIAQLLRTHPFMVFLLPLWFFRGRAYAKRRLAELAPLDPEFLPYDERVLDYVKEARSEGRSTVLISASDHEEVFRIAAYLGIFDDALGSSPGRNLKGAAKRRCLEALYPDGFVYAGDAGADLAVWSGAAAAVVVNASPGLAWRVRRDVPVEAEFPREGGEASALLKSFRLHHWAKNALIFLPMILAYRMFEIETVLVCLGGFLAFGTTASATYVLNDFIDMQADRQHPTKSSRPLASGRLRIPTALMAMGVMYPGGLLACYLLSPAFSAAVFGYLLITTLYSTSLKRMAMVDVLALAVLFTIRVLMGVLLIDDAISIWLMMFSLTFFAGLSFVKRLVELDRAVAAGMDVIPGRAFGTTDRLVIQVFGMATSILSVNVLVLYLLNDNAINRYTEAGWLWAVPLLMYFWQARIWLLTLRQQMSDDPLVFALKDRTSWAVGAITMSALTLAALQLPGG